MICGGCTTRNRIGPVIIDGEVIVRPLKGRVEIIGQISRANDEE